MKKHGPSIHIDKKQYHAPSKEMTGQELKALGSVPEDYMLFKVVPGPDPDEPIGDTEIVLLKNGNHFYSLPAGVVGQRLPGVEAEIAELLHVFPDAELIEDGSNIFVELCVQVPRSKGWDQTDTRILVPFPANYPASKPPNFFVDPTLTRGGAHPGGRGGPVTVVGKQWAPMCWNPKTEARDSMVRCVRFVER